jgi:hypothetical protein
MDEDTIRTALEHIEKLLRDPTCVIEFERGVSKQDRGDSHWHYEPTSGQTVTIKVHGGAYEVVVLPYVARSELLNTADS